MADAVPMVMASVRATETMVDQQNKTDQSESKTAGLVRALSAFHLFMPAAPGQRRFGS